MKKKGNFRKVVSGLLAGMTMLSTVLSPMTAYAAEIQPEKKPPLYEEVKDLLDEDEVVTAKDYEIEIGSVFDVKSDYTGLEIKDDNKVKVTFEEAKNEKNEDFTTDHADTYKAVYYVEPVNQEHPKYQISRKLIVREKETETQTETAGSEAVTESETAGSEQQTEEAEDSEAESEITDIDADEFDDLVEQAQNQDTYDEESGLELHDVLEQAGDEGVDLDSMEEGEIATFEAVSAYSARSTQQVTIEKGPLYRYADYNLGTYLFTKKEKVDEITVKLTGWRDKMYPLTIFAGKKKVWEGYTYACLGYVHIKIDKPVKAKDITIRMLGDAKSKTQLSDTKELAGGKASTLDFIGIKKGKPVLRIVEIDFLKNKKNK